MSDYIMPLEIVFRDESLARLEADPTFTGGWEPAIVKSFRRRMQQIRSVIDERDLYAIRSLRFKKLKGNRSHQHSMRLNLKWRLIVELTGKNPAQKIAILGIEDYH